MRYYACVMKQRNKSVELRRWCFAGNVDLDSPEVKLILL